jgi:hypothetical protein
MPARSETFVYDDDRNVFQGMMKDDESFHYWGSLTQGTKEKVRGNECKKRYTYFVATASSKTETATVAIEAVSFTKRSLGMELSASLGAIACLFILFSG